jgi:hypothetical protein
VMLCITKSGYLDSYRLTLRGLEFEYDGQWLEIRQPVRVLWHILLRQGWYMDCTIRLER